jgi:hypothetical protein
MIRFAMSGLGRVQRAIVMLADHGEADFYALEDLANWIYHRPASNAQRTAVLSAAQSLARRYPKIITLAKDEIGRSLLVIRRD